MKTSVPEVTLHKAYSRPIDEWICENRATFCCPKCGGHAYGSSLPTVEIEKMWGHCHNYLSDGQPCAFSWPHADDHKYFYLNGKRFGE